MGAFFRSEKMSLCQIFIQPEASYATVSEFGETGNVQFCDLNVDKSILQRKYVKEVLQCDEMERKLRFIKDEVKKDGLIFKNKIDDVPRAPLLRDINNLQAIIEQTECNIRELKEIGVNLKHDIIQLTELRQILEMMQIFFSEEEECSYSLIRALINRESQYRSIIGREHLEFITGVICRERMPAFERMLWRVSRGNLFLRHVRLSKPLEDPNTGNEVYKIAFVIFFQGEQLKNRIQKISCGFHASLYACPSKYSERIDMVKEVCVRLEELKMVLNQTQEVRHRVLSNVINKLPTWIIMVHKIKAIFHTMNSFDFNISKKCLIAECWVPTLDLITVEKCLIKGSLESNSSVISFFNVISTNEEPPTFNRINKFTHAFQILINTYGIASYREINPALSTIVTFPFLFAIMYGDAGHGLLLFIISLYLVIWENTFISYGWKDEIWRIFFGGRYVILLMGLFSVYTGLIYNDIFSKSVNLFGSQWKINNENYTFHRLQAHNIIMIDPKDAYTETPYLMGIDPVWMSAKNKIIFLNSYKMKLSIILGFLHMTFGMMLSAINYIHFKKYSSLFLELLPQLIFLISLFGYFIFLLFFKWIHYSATETGKFSERCAPSVLITFIDIFSSLFPTEKQKALKGCVSFMYPNQNIVHIILLIVIIMCILILLFGKPFYTLRSIKKTKLKRNKDIEDDGEIKKNNSEGDRGELMTYQSIYTIEFVLSTVTHIASYLRLWSLALAHAQLTQLLWGLFSFFFHTFNSLDISSKYNGKFFGSIGFFLGFAIWSCLTFILAIVGGLSAFLHTLRLHWIEFMSNFYNAHGYPFQPFCFKTIIDLEQQEISNNEPT